MMDEITSLREQLSAAQATIKRMRSALEQIAWGNVADHHVSIDETTLALPNDTTALDARLAQERERCAKACETERDRILSKQSGRECDPVDINLRMAAWGGADPCAAAIRSMT